jgi:broad specificity phosphatase PhoE
VLTRSMEALNDTCRRVAGGTAVVVSHDAVNSLLLAALDESLGESETVTQDTGCFNVLEYDRHRWSILSVNNAPAGHDSPPLPGQQVHSPRSETQTISKETRHG